MCDAAPLLRTAFCAILRASGLQYPPLTDIFGKSDREHLRNVGLPKETRRQVDRLLELLEQTEDILSEIDRWVKEVRSNEDAQLLMSMFGIGEFGALLLAVCGAVQQRQEVMR